jgi:hypothetical protein
MKQPSQPLSDQLHAAKAVEGETGIFVTEVAQAPTSALSYDKRVFVPYKDERDHLGRLIDPQHHTYMQIPNNRGYIKKQIHVFNNKLYLSDEIPTRWKEAWKREAAASKDQMTSYASGLVGNHDKLQNSPSIKNLGNSMEGLPVKNEEYFEKQEQREMKRLNSAMSSVRLIIATL